MSLVSRFHESLRALRSEKTWRFALAEINDMLDAVSPAQLCEAVGDVELAGLSPLLQNYVAAMVEHAAGRKGVQPPAWVRHVTPLEEPYFAAPFTRLRPHLLRSAPVAFKRRNIFIDSTVGDRV